jgi:hypothetical protein
MIHVVVDPSSLKRSQGGNISGCIFLCGPSGAFPDDRWSDFPVVILGWWIDGLSQVVNGQLSFFRGLFMEAPVAFVVHRGVGHSARIAWGNRNEEASIGIVQVPALLQSAIAAGRLVAAACRDRSWTTADLAHLERAIATSAV